ncbi:MAG TPA: sulfite exporter TauE/SafE family protein [Magnetospirillaceae bacterium]|jgi:hypothetical protein
MHDGYLPYVLIGLTFVLAGVIKGVTGMGLPTVAIGLLGLIMAPAEAAALLVIPSVVTNVWQFVAGPNRVQTAKRIWTMLIAIFIATWLSTGLIAGGGMSNATLGLGIALVVYALVGLAKVQLTVSRPMERWLAPVIGAATGVVTGATGVFVIPAVPYLQALGLNKDDLVQTLGLSFTVSTIALAAGLATHDAFHITAVGESAVCTAPALIGMMAGQWVRARVNPTTFRLLFFIGLLILGANLILRSVL